MVTMSSTLSAHPMLPAPWALAAPGSTANSAPPPSSAAELARKPLREDSPSSTPTAVDAPRDRFSDIPVPSFSAAEVRDHPGPNNTMTWGGYVGGVRARSQRASASAPRPSQKGTDGRAPTTGELRRIALPRTGVNRGMEK